MPKTTKNKPQKERRSLFQMIFGRVKQDKNQYTQAKFLNGYHAIYGNSYIDDAYASDIVRSAVDAVARNGAKLKAKHVRRMNNQLANVNSSIEYLLQTEPNPYMDAYQFLYKIFTNYCMKNNSFVYIQRDDNGKVVGYYPLSYQSAEAMESAGELYIKFQFASGDTKTLPYADLIHLKRHFYKNDIFGESSDVALQPTLELINTSNNGIINAIKSSAAIRGLLKFSTSLRPDDMKKQKDQFIKDYMGLDNNGGIAATDGKFDFQSIENKPIMIAKDQLDYIKNAVYDYFGVSEPIIQNKYNEEQWQAFYESCLEPIAVQLGLQVTIKSFSAKEKGFGNEVIFESQRLQYASTQSKRELIKDLLPTGILTINQALEILNMAPIPDGDKRIMSLNYIDANAATEYQLNKARRGKQDGKQKQEPTE